MRTKGLIIPGVPPPRIIYQSPKIDTDDPTKLTIVASYKISAGNNTHLLEFFHCYAAIRIDESDYMLGFATIKAEALPPDFLLDRTYSKGSR